MHDDQQSNRESHVTETTVISAGSGGADVERGERIERVTHNEQREQHAAHAHDTAQHEHAQGMERSGPGDSESHGDSFKTPGETTPELKGAVPPLQQHEQSAAMLMGTAEPADGDTSAGR